MNRPHSELTMPNDIDASVEGGVRPSHYQPG